MDVMAKVNVNAFIGHTHTILHTTHYNLCTTIAHPKSYKNLHKASQQTFEFNVVITGLQTKAKHTNIIYCKNILS